MRWRQPLRPVVVATLPLQALPIIRKAGLMRRFADSVADAGLALAGLRAFCADPGGWAAWYSEADRALYAAKRQGGDAWRLDE